MLLHALFCVISVAVLSQWASKPSCARPSLRLMKVQTILLAASSEATRQVKYWPTVCSQSASHGCKFTCNVLEIGVYSIVSELYRTESAKSLLYSRGCRRWFLDVLIPRCSSCLARPVQNMARCQCWVWTWMGQMDLKISRKIAGPIPSSC